LASRIKNKKNVNLDYEDRLIIYIDILGFTNFIDYTTQTKINRSEKIIKINNLLKLIKSYFEVKYKNLQVSKTRQYTSFSDLLVVSINLKEIKNIAFEIYEIYNLLKEANYNGFLLRGAIVYGKIIHTKDVLFGPGIISAYNKERNIAKYPRIIIDNVIVSDLIELYEQEQDYCYYDNIISRDIDGLYYIDLFKTLRDDVIDSFEYLSLLLSICDILLELIDNKPLEDKYIWLRNKYVTHINNNTDIIAHSFSNIVNITKDDLSTLKMMLEEQKDELKYLLIKQIDSPIILTNDESRVASFKILSEQLKSHLSHNNKF